MPPLDARKRLEVFYDSDCPLCDREIKVMRWLDRKNRVQFTDVMSDDFDAAAYGLTFDDFMDEIQGRLAPDRWITGVDVLYEMYRTVGFWWLVWPMKVPGISHFCEWGYAVFARNRLKWTGRCKEDCKVPSST